MLYAFISNQGSSTAFYKNPDGVLNKEKAAKHVSRQNIFNPWVCLSKNPSKARGIIQPLSLSLQFLLLNADSYKISTHKIYIL